MAISNAEARSLIMGALYYSGPKVDPKEVGRIFNYTGEIEGNGRRQFGEFLLGSFTLQGLEVIMKLDQDKRLEVLASAWDLGEKSAISAKVALVDGNLDSSLSGRDGRHIEGLLRAKNPNIFIVEVSAFGNALLNPNSVFRKREINNQEAVTSLFEKLNALKS